MTNVTETTNVSDKHEELFTRIALDNKLITRFQLKKATDEQDRRAKEDGKRPPIGDVLKALGFLNERQFQSVVNAQRYREQRDYDKRFGRQVLRMQLLDQAKVEEGLEGQKTVYTKTGAVKTLAEVLVEKKLLTTAQVDEVKHQIQVRDKKKSSPGSSATRAAVQKKDEDDDSMKLADLDAAAPESAKAEDEDAEEEDEEEDDEEEDEDDAEEDEAEEEDEDDEEEDEEEEDDEDDLAEDLEDLPDGEDVELDAKDLEAIEELESSEEPVDEKGWAADAFDDRPLQKREGEGSDAGKPITRAPKPSSREKAAAAPPPAAKKPVSTRVEKPAPPSPPRAPGKSERLQTTPPSAPRPATQKLQTNELSPLAHVSPKDAAPKDSVKIPGGEVLNDSSLGNVEGVPVTPAQKPIDIPGGSVFKDVPSQSGIASASQSESSVEEKPAPTPAKKAQSERLESSAEAIEELLDKAEATPTPARGISRPPLRFPPRPSPAREGALTRNKTQGTAASNPLGASIGSGLTGDASTKTAGSEPPDTANDEFAALGNLETPSTPPRPASAPDEAALRRAFEKAFDHAKEIAWKKLLEELGRGS